MFVDGYTNRYLNCYSCLFTVMKHEYNHCMIINIDVYYDITMVLISMGGWKSRYMCTHQLKYHIVDYGYPQHI